MAGITCWIYRSSRHEGLYLYLSKQDGFDDLPDALTKKMGTPSLVMELELTPERRLAQVDSARVIEAIEAQGYFLQIPPDLNPQLYFGD